MNSYIFARSNFLAMPKMKTKSGAKKRFKLTGTNKVKRKRAFKRHILTKKAHDRKKGLSRPALVSSADMPRMKQMLLF